MISISLTEKRRRGKLILLGWWFDIPWSINDRILEQKNKIGYLSIFLSRVSETF